MQICPSCGEENPPRFRLCGFCGTALGAALEAPETRKTVTIVFSDLKGSTSLGEQLDSEALREVMSRYFDRMSAVLEEHGGTVEKYIGDAIMAVFGLPVVHEDDAIRAVRAASSMKTALASLNDELEQHYGVRLANRTGVNTGEVVAGDVSTGQRLVTGDAVNVAARLEQAAPALEILLGESTYRLVRHAVEVETVEPLELKGKAERVPAYRLLAVPDSVDAVHRTQSPVVGREEEFAVLEECLDEVRASRTGLVVTLIGDAGLGKSRLLAELTTAAREDGCRVLRGRCLPYGRGITFWPLVEIMREAAGIDEDDASADARAKLAALVGSDAEDVAERVAAAIGLTTAPFPLPELFWGTRKLFEALAGERPLVVVFEDIHWAEATMLDLIEHVAQATNVPLLILCATRPDLLEHRPTWAEREGGTRLRLKPLSEDDSARVIEHALGDVVADDVRTRIIAAAEGNPLFVEQLVSMLVEDGLLKQEEGRWVATSDLSQLSVPPTINALLTARLDLLTLEERAVLDPASVVGLLFHRAAIDELAPDQLRGQVDPLLGALAAKRLIRSDADDGREMLRFEHILIRDAAYQRLLKRARATFHERFADWAERFNRDRDREVEYEEILGYHLEQAYLYLEELGPLDDHGRTLGARAFERLSSAGRRAFVRGDMPAAANLLRRATMLLPERDAKRLAVLPDLGEALMEIGEFAWAEIFLGEAVDGAAAAGDVRLEMDAMLTRLLVRHHIAEDLQAWRTEVEQEARHAITVLEEIEAHAQLSKAWRLLGFVHGSVCRYGEAEAAMQEAVRHAQFAGDERQEARNASEYALAGLYGPTPVPDAILRGERLLAEGLVNRQAEALVLRSLAQLQAMQGDFERARDLYTRARALLDDLGVAVLGASTSLHSGYVELLAGDPAAAERELRRGHEALTELGERYLLPYVTAMLARAVYEQGRLEEAAEVAELAEVLSAADDFETRAIWLGVRAKVLAARGEHDEAEQLAAAGAELLRQTDSPVKQADALMDLAEVLIVAGKVRAAQAIVEESATLYTGKRNIVAAARARSVLDELARAAVAAGP